MRRSVRGLLLMVALGAAPVTASAQQTETVHFPARQKYAHNYRVREAHDRATDSTEVAVAVPLGGGSSGFLKGLSRLSQAVGLGGFTLVAGARYAGAAVTAVPPEVRLEVRFNDLLPEERTGHSQEALELVLDERDTVRLTLALFDQGARDEAGHLFKEYYATSVPLRTYLRLTDASAVRGRIRDKKIELTGDRLEALRDVASRLAPASGAPVLYASIEQAPVAVKAAPSSGSPAAEPQAQEPSASGSPASGEGEQSEKPARTFAVDASARTLMDAILEKTQARGSAGTDSLPVRPATPTSLVPAAVYVARDGQGQPHLVAVQPAGTDASDENPEARSAYAELEAGGTAYLLDTAAGAVTPHRALARVRVLDMCEGSGLGNGPGNGGWAYLLDAPAQGITEEKASSLVALPLAASARPMTHPPASTVAGFRPTYLAELRKAYARIDFRYAVVSRADMRKQMFGASGTGSLSQKDFWALRGPKGPLAIVSLGLNNDSDDKGFQTELTFIVGPTGAVLARDESGRTLLGIADLDGDGVDEIITENGLIRWTGTRWTFPAREQHGGGCD